MPEFLIGLFRTDRSKNQLKESSLFDHCKVRNIFFRNGRNETFPNNSWNLDITSSNKLSISSHEVARMCAAESVLSDNIACSKFLKMYDAYTIIKRVVLKNTEIILSPKEFLSSVPMYVINTSNRRETIVKNKTNIKISVDLSAVVPANTLCYVILLRKKKLNYDIIYEKITEVF